MPVPDQRTGNIFVWFLSFLFFLAIIAGGIFLIIYISVPVTESTAWFPVAGVVLVAIPWFFWFLTILYRCISRAVFSRGSGGGGGGGGRGAGGGANVGPTTMAEVGATTSNSPKVESPAGGAARVHFGTTIVVDDQELSQEGDAGHRSRGRTSGSSSLSSSSRESEMPLTLSMSS